MKLLKYYDRVKYDNNLSHPKMLTWDITNKCNLSCKHCLNNSGDCNHHNFEEELTEDEQIDLAYQIAAMKPEQCCLCGGETLLNKNIYNIISIISAAGVMVNMVTNGILLSDEVAKKLKKSGVSHVQISIDGLGCQHNIFRNTKGAFEKSIKAIEVLNNNGMAVMVSCCPSKLNFGTIETYVEYMHDVLCVKNIRMMPLLPIGRASNECGDLFLNSFEYYIMVQKIIQLREKYPDIKIEWGDPLEHLFLILFNKRKYPIVMSISSTGDLTLSPYIPMIFGNIRGDNLNSIWLRGYNKLWGNPEVLSIIKKVKSIYDLGQFSDKLMIEESSWKNI